MTQATTVCLLVAAAADGAGSASQGELGADVAVATVLEELRRCRGGVERDAAGVLREAALCAREAIVRRAGEAALEPRDCATTLLVAVATAAGGGALQIGDGAVVVGAGDDHWRWMFWPQRGEFVNSTRFLTDPDAADVMQVAAFEAPPVDVALLTDGLEPLAIHYASRTAHEPFFRAMFRPLAASPDGIPGGGLPGGGLPGDGGEEVGPLSAVLAVFLDTDRVRGRSDDDLSLILATRRRPVCDSG